jgi:hypothetical protein
VAARFGDNEDGPTWALTRDFIKLYVVCYLQKRVKASCAVEMVEFIYKFELLEFHIEESCYLTHRCRNGKYFG